MQAIKLFLLALSFYTRLPCSIRLDYQRLSAASVYLPLIGWVVGGIMALGFLLADMLWSQATAVIMALSMGVFLTGALHEDGFADVCDGFGGAYDKQRILEIMKDSSIGVYGCLGLILLLLLKFSLLSNAPASSVPLLLLTGHSVSRLPPLWLMQRYPYARSHDSKAAMAVYPPNQKDMTIATISALLPLLLLPYLCLLAMLPIWLATGALGRYFDRHIGGYTGDCLGATQQVSETLFYLSATALWTFI